MIQKKSTNKFLLTTSLFSLTMGMLSFNAMAADSTNEHQVENVAKTIKAINYETGNTQYPGTSNDKAINKTTEDEIFRGLADNENFCFRGPDGKCMNCESSNNIHCNDSPVSESKSNSTGYIVAKANNLNNSGYISGGKEVESSGNGNNLFFKYWNPTGESRKKGSGDDLIKDPQFSASFPKLCYSGSGLSFSSPKSLAMKDGKYTDPLIRLTKSGGDSEKDKKMEYIGTSKESFGHKIRIPIKKANIAVGASNEGAINTGVDFSGTLDCVTSGGCRLVKDTNRDCFKVEINKQLTSVAKVDETRKNSNLGYKFNIDGLQSVTTISKCPNENASKYSGSNCGAEYVKSFAADSDNTPYRQSAFVSIDINGNSELIEIPDQTCYKCVNVNAGPSDASCEYIVKEVWDAKKGSSNHCEETVKALVTDPRTSTKLSYLPSNMNTQYNCQTCLCKIEQILRKAPYNCG